MTDGAPSTDLFFIVVGAVIFGGILSGLATAAVIRYSRHEESGLSPRGIDLVFPLLAAALVLYAIYLAGLF